MNKTLRIGAFIVVTGLCIVLMSFAIEGVIMHSGPSTITGLGFALAAFGLMILAFGAFFDKR